MEHSLIDEQIRGLQRDVQQQLQHEPAGLTALAALKQRVFGRRGQWQQLYTRCCQLDSQQRLATLKLLNQVKVVLSRQLQVAIRAATALVYHDYWQQSGVDPTLPLLQQPSLGGNHPLYLVRQQLITMMGELGYQYVQHAEVETTTYNFQLLNITATHPLFVNNDTFTFDSHLVARTHTTASTARLLEQMAATKQTATAPGRAAFFTHGAVFRRDDDDATHAHQFQQLDAVAIGADLNVSHLVWTVQQLLRRVLGSQVNMRLRPTYFPFTEPSLEVDVYDQQQQRYVEVLGGGMVNPAVLALCGWTNPVRAFAFGIGLERLAMLKFHFHNLHDCYRNDLRWLAQFKVD